MTAFTSSESKFDEAEGFGANHVVSSKDSAAIETMLDFTSRHNVAPQIEHFPMSNINEAFARLESGKARYRIVLDADF